MDAREPGNREGALAAPPVGYQIRLATAGDLPLLAGIERATAAMFADYGLAELFAAETTPIEELAAKLDAGRLWVATGGCDSPVGFALAGIVGDNAHLEELDVHPDHGRRGLGTALVDAVQTWARDSGYPALTLTTFRNVPWNAPFYKRLGFRIVEATALSQALTEVLAAEIARGLPAEHRVAMRKTLS